MLKQQEQAINKELWSWEIKHKKAERLTNYLDEINQFSTKYLAEAIKPEKAKENRDDWCLEYCLENKIAFAWLIYLPRALICLNSSSTSFVVVEIINYFQPFEVPLTLIFFGLNTAIGFLFSPLKVTLC